MGERTSEDKTQKSQGQVSANDLALAYLHGDLWRYGLDPNTQQVFEALIDILLKGKL